MEYAPEEYTRHYIVEALFKLMHENEFDKITIKDVSNKAGVGRATFYRYFKSKEDVIEFYFSHNTDEFISMQHYIPRCKEDYLEIVKSVFEKFKKNKDCFVLLNRAHLSYLYLNFLNRKFTETFSRDFVNSNPYLPYLYAGMVYNVSMRWLDDDCKGDIENLSKMFINAIYFQDKES